MTDDRIQALLCGLARNPALPASIVDRLIALADPEVLDTLTGRGDLTADQVTGLAQRGDDQVIARLVDTGLLRLDQVDRYGAGTVVAMAEKGPVREDWLRRVAFEESPWIRDRLMETRYLPPELVCEVAADPDPEIAAQAAASPSLPVAELARLAEHPHASVRRAVVFHERVPVEVLVRLVERRVAPVELCGGCDGAGNWTAEYWDCDGTTHADAQDDLDEALARPGRTPGAVLEHFATHRSQLVRGALAERTDLSAEAYRALAADPVPGTRRALAMNPRISPDLLRTLAGDPSKDVRWSLAQNPLIPLDVLARVAASTRIGAAQLPRIAAATPAEVLALADSSVPELRMLLAERPELPPAVVRRLAEDPDAKVLKSIAAHPAVSATRLHAMVEAHGPRVATRVATNPTCPPELLLRIAHSRPPVQKALRRIAGHANAPAAALLVCLTDPQARPIAARHPALPPDLITELLTHDDVTVAAAAAANPALPLTAMTHLCVRAGG